MERKLKDYTHNDILVFEALIEKFDFHELSETSNIIRSKIESNDYPNIIFNFNKVKYIDSSTFGFLIELKKPVEKNKNKIIIVCRDRDLKSIIRLINLDRIFNVFSSIDDAYEFFNNQ